MPHPSDTPGAFHDGPETPRWIREAFHVLTVLWRVLAGLGLLIASIHFYLLVAGGDQGPGTPIGAALAAAGLGLVAVLVAVYLGRGHDRAVRGEALPRGTLIFAEVAAVVLVLYLASIVVYVRSLGWIG